MNFIDNVTLNGLKISDCMFTLHSTNDKRCSFAPNEAEKTNDARAHVSVVFFLSEEFFVEQKAQIDHCRSSTSLSLFDAVRIDSSGIVEKNETFCFF